MRVRQVLHQHLPLIRREAHTVRGDHAPDGHIPAFRGTTRLINTVHATLFLREVACDALAVEQGLRVRGRFGVYNQRRTCHGDCKREVSQR
ncbi:hypothetical protein D3C85_1747940 [compost metagenome]